MSLPQIANDSFTTIELLSGKKIGVKPWRVKEEKELLFATENIEDEIAVRAEVVKFMRKCVDNVSLFNTLSNTDYIHLIAQLRKLSKGSKIEYTYKCNSCGFPLSDDVSLDKHLKFKKFDDAVIVVSDDLKFAIKEVPFSVYDALSQKYTKTSEYNFYYVVASIDSIVYKDEVFDQFSTPELIEFLDQLKSEQYTSLLEKISAAGAEIYLEKTLKCGKCKHENQVAFGDLYRFLSF